MQDRIMFPQETEQTEPQQMSHTMALSSHRKGEKIMQHHWKKYVGNSLRVLAAAAVLVASHAQAQNTQQVGASEPGQTVVNEDPSTGQGELVFGAPSQQPLGQCWPADDCSTPDKPCYLELTKDNHSAVLIGSDETAPLVGGAAFRVRLCTSNADPLDNAVCEDFIEDQEAHYTFYNLKEGTPEGQIVIWGVLDPTTDTIDSGPYSQVGAHNFFGAICQHSDEPCRIAWQYCELLPPDPTETLTTR